VLFYHKIIQTKVIKISGGGLTELEGGEMGTMFPIFCKYIYLALCFFYPGWPSFLVPETHYWWTDWV